MPSNPFLKERLFCPGPTPVPLATALATINASVYHRSEEFYTDFQSCQKLLAPFFGTRSLPLILTSSGTGAMEAAMTNLTQEGDEVIVVEGGKFGQRWGSLAEQFGCKVHRVTVDWGQAPTKDMLIKAVERVPNAKAVFIQANETSTGVFYPLAELLPELRRKTQALIVVDAISALVAHEMKMDDWGIDCVVSGSQKGFGVPPGLAFIALSDHAWSRLSKRGSYYFSLKKELENQKKGATAYTPAVSLIYGLKDSLSKLAAFGVEGCVGHHARLAAACRSAVKAMGLELYPSGNYSNALTAVSVPEECFKNGLMRELKNFGMVFAGGQDHLKNKIVRISHLGFMDEFDLLGGIAGLEMALVKTGGKNCLGNGSKALLESLTKA